MPEKTVPAKGKTENVTVQKMLEKNRRNMPSYIKHSTFNVNIIKKRLKIKDNYTLEKAAAGDLDLLSIRSTFHFAPLVNHYDDFYVLKDENGDVLACGKVWEQWDYKQYIVKKYSWKYKLIKPFVRWLPNENESFIYLVDWDKQGLPSEIMSEKMMIETALL